MSKIVKIADIKILIDTSHKVGELIAEDLGAREEEDEADISIKFGRNLDLSGEIMSGNYCIFNENEFLCKSLNPIHYKIINLFKNKETVVEINILPYNIKTKLQSLIYGRYKLEKNIILSYSLFWYVLQIELLKRKKTFLHAGIFSNSDEAIALTGTGGSGKTSVLFKVLENDKYKYMAEDFGIIGTDLYAYYNPKPLSIYESDIKYNPKILKNTYDFLSLTDRIRWNFQLKALKKNPIIKLNPKKLLPKQIVSKSRLKKILYLLRTNTKSIQVYTITAEELTERSLNVALRELKVFFEVLTLLNANKKNDYQFLTINELMERMRNIYINIFNNTQNYLVEIPFREKPMNIVEFLKNKGII